MLPISVTILTKNSEKHLQVVLEALKEFDEVLLCDTGSLDRTLEIGAAFPNVRIETLCFTGFGPTHNEASALAKHDWIFSLDSDEILSPALLEELRHVPLRRGMVASVPRKNFYRGKWIWGCGWYPDRVVRLYNRRETEFSSAQVHEAVQCKGLHVHLLQGPLFHYSYDTVADFLQKMQIYTQLFAEQNRGKRSSSLFRAIVHGSFSFFKAYILQGGIFLGVEGFEISWYNANTTFYKYLKLWEMNRKKEGVDE